MKYTVTELAQCKVHRKGAFLVVAMAFQPLEHALAIVATDVNSKVWYKYTVNKLTQCLEVAVAFYPIEHALAMVATDTNSKVWKSTQFMSLPSNSRGIPSTRACASHSGH
jgi:hypothetical protein